MLIALETVRRAGERIAEHARAHRLPEVRVILHGGEPLLAGVPVLAEIVRVLRAAIEPACRPHLRIHTNGARFDVEFCDLFLVEQVRAGFPSTATGARTTCTIGRPVGAAATTRRCVPLLCSTWPVIAARVLGFRACRSVAVTCSRSADAIVSFIISFGIKMPAALLAKKPTCGVGTACLEGGDVDTENKADGPIFFFSYSRTPRINRHDHADPDDLAGKFFEDVCRSLVQLSALPMGEGIGFMDREFRAGHEWPKRLAQALATCKVFVPLYSPRYFTKENCGKEWTAFAERVAEAAVRRGEQVEAIVPALWVPVRDGLLPEVVQSIQYWTPSYGSRYADHGLYRLMKSKYEAEYEEVVFELATRILEVAENCHLEPGRTSEYNSLRNAFEADPQKS